MHCKESDIEICTENIKAQTAPDKKEILKVTLQVNDYFMKK